MRVQIDVWSDYVCPFCYLEEPVLDRIAKEYGELVRIDWRPFELRPDPVPTLEPNCTYLRDIWARAVYPMAMERGMGLRLPPVQPRSRLAHEAALFSKTESLFGAMNSALFKAFFGEGRDIGDLMTLVEIGKGIGLDPESLRQALEEGRHLRRVLAEEDQALKLGISGVPAMLIHHDAEPPERATQVSGAQSFEYVHAVLERVLAAKVYNAAHEL
jgi:predicted DsbA family dithiol-disulfide isomerase